MHAASEAILIVEQLQVSYRSKEQARPILHGLNLTLHQGETVCLLGESGSGKSTLAKAITGLLPPSAQVGSGSLALAGGIAVDLADDNGSGSIPWQRIRGTELALLFQDARQALNPVMTIGQHFKETLLDHRKAKPDEVESISCRLLRKLGFTDPLVLLSSYPFQLSGGMCQRICLAIALCLEPKVLIADEPTSALDTVSQREVLSLIRAMQLDLGLTVLLITHDLAVARAVSDRVIVLDQGRLVEQGSVQRVFSQPKALFTRQLLAYRSQVSAPAKLRSTRKSSACLLEVRRLHKSYDANQPIVRDASLTLDEQEIVGVLGQSGCGKSTLARCIAGLETPNAGSILLRGTDISGLQGKARREICRRIQMVFQDARASLHPGRTAQQLVQEPLQYLRIGNKQERIALASHYLQEVGIEGEAQYRKPPQLSTGQCQRIAIARALVLKPEVLICDEAVSALDVRIQAQILKLLKRLHKQYRFSILMISHDVSVLRSFCHHIAVMSDGRFQEGKQASVRLHESSQPHTQLLLRCAGDLEEVRI